MRVETIEYPQLRLEIEGGLATIVFNDPDRLNAVSHHMASSLVGALQEVAKPRRNIRCVMLTGEGRGFCAGANMARNRSQLEGERQASPPAISGVESLFHPLIRLLRDVKAPIVAAVNGPCAGIGLAMALFADYIIASDDAFFLVPFRNLASMSDSGLTWLLPRAIGLQRARQMIMRAERVGAQRAYEWGLANEVVSAAEFREAAKRVAVEYAEGPTVALSAMRHLILNSDNVSLDSQIEAEARAVRVTSRTKDNDAAIRVFGTKTKPEFIGA